MNAFITGCLGLFVVAVSLALFVACDDDDSSSSASSDGKQSSVIEISATQLTREYKNNEIAADNSYKGKTLQVTGTIEDM